LDAAAAIRQNAVLMQPPPVSERDPESLARYLLSFRWPFRNEFVHHILVKGGLPLWRQVLRFVPNPRERGRALELGSPPFHITLLLQRFRNYDLSLTGYATDGRPEIRQVLESPEFGETHEFVCTCFNAEADTFPYPDDTFDLVTWCEVIEHLTENPVHTLAEIHRVLKPGGALVISTPNASRADSIANFLLGRNIYDPYHLGAPLKGSRHSREYTLPELTDLLQGCGYTVERAADIDIYPAVSRNRRAFRWLLNNLVRRLTRGHYRYHLFVRARKTEAPFRWYFPAALFDTGHLGFYIAPRDPAVTFGINEVPHIAFGWGDLQTGPDERQYRRSGPVGDIYLLVREPRSAVTVTLANGRGEAQAWHDNGGDLLLLGSTRFDAPPGRWTDVTIPLSSRFEPGNPLHVRLETEAGVDVHRVQTT
jgi:SAM-dependent methyltransferase